MDADVATRIDELYAQPLERFVADRDALAKALRAEGRRTEAGEVAALPKPSVAAWAVNQVVRSQPKAARELWGAGDAVLEVQERVMAGDASGQDLRAAVDRERRALAPLADAARGLLTGTGRFLGDQNVQAVTETLHAAAVDREAREPVAAGRTHRPLRLTGITAGAASAAPTRPQGPARPPRDTAAQRLADRQAADEADEQERRRDEAATRKRRAEAQKAVVRAERDRDRARERVREAAADRDAASKRVEAALKELGAAEDELGRAEQALIKGHDALERAEGAVEAAREDVEGT